MSRSDWYISDEAGRAIAGLARDDEPRAKLFAQPEVARLAHRHGLVVPAARRLGTSSPRGQYLAAVVARMSARNACIDGHLHRILTQMAHEGVRASVVKGPAVAQHYADPSVRTYTDVDVVVPGEELEDALRVLRSYESTGAVPAKVPAADKRDIVIRDPTGIEFTVDLHWNLFSFHQLGTSAAAAMSRAWEGAIFEPDRSLGPMWKLPDEVVLSFLGLHALLDHRFRLILFRDLLEVAARRPDWERLVSFATEYEMASLQYLTWLIATEVVQANPPDWFLERLGTHSMAERVAEHYLSRVDLVRFNGHRVHPLNLAITQIHDDPSQRRRLLVRAPFAYAGWRRRVQVTPGDGLMTVDILVTSNALRGAEVFGRLLTDQLVLRGWDVSLISLRGGDTPGVSSTPVVDEGVDLGGVRWRVVAGVRRRFRSHRPSLVFVNGGATLRYAVVASLLTWPRPTLIYGSIGEPTFWLRGRFHRWWLRLLIRACRHVTAVSHATGQALLESLAVPQEKVSVVHLGVEDSWFRVSPRQHGDGPMRILFAGRMSFEKDPHSALEAVAALGQDAAVMRMVGDGPLREEVEEAALPQVEVLGAVEDMAAQMQWADVLLLTSLTEGFPGVVVEAAAAGLPVVASNVGGTGEIVTDGQTGYLVEPADIDGFVAALRTLADDRQLRLKLGEAGREQARTRFRLSDTVDAYESLFREVGTS